MKVTILFVLLSSALVFAQNDVDKKPKAIIHVEIVQQVGLESVLLDIVDDLEQVFDLGSGCEGRMQLLKASLYNKLDKHWVVAEEACNLQYDSATTTVYGHFEVTYNGQVRDVQIVGYKKQ